MAKDPAILWYWNDWQGGTMTLTRHLKGCYMDILSAQFNSGPLSLDEIKTVLGTDFGSAWPTLQKKFVKGENGLFVNARMAAEMDKRKKHSEQQKKNASMRWHKNGNATAYAKPMPLENEDENAIETSNENQGVQGDFDDWNRWADAIVERVDQYWEQMRGRDVSRAEMDEFLSVATRNEWTMKTQQAFRTTLNGFKSNAKPKFNEPTKRTSANAITEPAPGGFGKL